MKQKIAANIARLRDECGMTQLELGVALGFTEEFAQTRISQYETGQRSPNKSTLEKIAEVLHVSADVLVREKQSMVAEERVPYGVITDKIIQMLCDMDAPAQRDVLKYAEEKKLVSQILKKRKAG